MSYPLSLIALLGHRRPLLLQGPMGPFFARFASFLETHNQRVRKVDFNGGDQVFYRRSGATAYTGTLHAWPSWLAHHIVSNRIDALVMFGQNRPVHEAARKVAAQLDIDVYVFEEGYVRPDYVTLEHGGVNGLSSLPRDAAYYASRPAQTVSAPAVTRASFHILAWHACVYIAAMLLWWPRYRLHVYHRPMNPMIEAVCWARGGFRKLLFRLVDRGKLGKLTAPERSGTWFLFPLQVHNDAQLLHHSPYRDMEAAIDEVMASFAAHATPDAHLVVKHHPMDRAYTNYRRFIKSRALRHGLLDRLHYVHDLHLPTLIRHAAGVVTVNSTTGMQALLHGTPVHALGDCFFKLPGLVHASLLRSFWTAPGAVDQSLFTRFRTYVVTHTQLNASFHGLWPTLTVPTVPARARARRNMGTQVSFRESVS